MRTYCRQCPETSQCTSWSAGAGAGDGWLRLLYHHADNDKKRTLRGSIVSIACDAWRVEDIELLTAAQMAFTLIIVRAPAQEESHILDMLRGVLIDGSVALPFPGRRQRLSWQHACLRKQSPHVVQAHALYMIHVEDRGLSQCASRRATDRVAAAQR